MIGYRRHTHKTETYGKYRIKYDFDFDTYICPEQHHLYWKTTTRQGYRKYFCDSKTCKECPGRTECFGKSMTRRMVERHVWQDYLDAADVFTKTPICRLRSIASPVIVTTTATLCAHCVNAAFNSYPRLKVSTILLPVCFCMAL